MKSDIWSNGAVHFFIKFILLNFLMMRSVEARSFSYEPQCPEEFKDQLNLFLYGCSPCLDVAPGLPNLNEMFFDLQPKLSEQFTVVPLLAENATVNNYLDVMACGLRGMFSVASHDEP